MTENEIKTRSLLSVSPVNSEHYYSHLVGCLKSLVVVIIKHRVGVVPDARVWIDQGNVGMYRNQFREYDDWKIMEEQYTFPHCYCLHVLELKQQNSHHFSQFKDY